MRKSLKIAVTLVLLAPPGAFAATDDGGRVYKWVDSDGVTHYGDSIPAQYSELPKQVLNDHGVTVKHLEGRKTEEQMAAERKAAELEMQKELQRRADQALLHTYLSVEEIVNHRDRRVELFRAQSRVTELYLRNLERELAKLRHDASRFSPYSEDPKAPKIDDDLVEAIQETEQTIARHKYNLQKFEAEEQQIIARFEGDINRFKALKGVE